MFMVLCETVTFSLSTEKTQSELVETPLLEYYEQTKLCYSSSAFQKMLLRTEKVYYIYVSKQYRKEPLL